MEVWRCGGEKHLRYSTHYNRLNELDVLTRVNEEHERQSEKGRVHPVSVCVPPFTGCMAPVKTHKDSLL